MRLTQSERELLEQVRSYIEDSNNYPIRIEEVVDRFDIKARKLTWGFRKLFKKSMYQYYQDHAMAYAKSLLKSGSQVKEAAITLGYSRPGTFSRAFQNHFGINPVKVRVR